MPHHGATQRPLVELRLDVPNFVGHGERIFHVLSLPRAIVVPSLLRGSDAQGGLPTQRLSRVPQNDDGLVRDPRL